MIHIGAGNEIVQVKYNHILAQTDNVGGFSIMIRVNDTGTFSIYTNATNEQGAAIGGIEITFKEMYELLTSFIAKK